MNGDEKQKTGLNGTERCVYLLAVVIAASIISGIAGSWWFTKNEVKKVVVIDIERIVNKRKEEFSRKYKNTDIDNVTTKTDMANDIKLFAEKLGRILEVESKNKVILKMDSVISDVEDITGKVERKIWGN
jgi:hypothetical protein